MVSLVNLVNVQVKDFGQFRVTVPNLLDVSILVLVLQSTSSVVALARFMTQILQDVIMFGQSAEKIVKILVVMKYQNHLNQVYLSNQNKGKQDNLVNQDIQDIQGDLDSLASKDSQDTQEKQDNLDNKDCLDNLDSKDIRSNQARQDNQAIQVNQDRLNSKVVPIHLASKEIPTNLGSKEHHQWYQKLLLKNRHLQTNALLKVSSQSMVIAASFIDVLTVVPGLQNTILVVDLILAMKYQNLLVKENPNMHSNLFSHRNLASKGMKSSLNIQDNKVNLGNQDNLDSQDSLKSLDSTASLDRQDSLESLDSQVRMDSKDIRGNQDRQGNQAIQVNQDRQNSKVVPVHQASKDILTSLDSKEHHQWYQK
ncbi:hypothetical protein J6590_047892 [Homalodisca vitripennis]|nr:hypothetical protein J6590_047892 [Homalodisca vitripennis]